MRSRQTKKLISYALGLIVLGSLWFWFAPTQLGGSTTYVVTHGISMEPRFHTGDLALVRAQSSYHVGEVVAYDSRMLHTIVLHRIIGRDGSRYVFKGDNNNFVDPEHPRASQLIGALWLHVGGVGATLQSIRSPLLLGALIAVAILMLAGSAFARRRRRLRGRARRSGEGTQARPAHSPRPSGAPAGGIVAVGLLLLLPFIVLALLAFSRSPTALSQYTIPYRQSGALTYTAQAPPGPAYPEGRVATGEPIFARIVKAIDFNFAYHLQATGRRQLGGTLALDAKVTSTYGWQRTLALAPPTRFRGSHAEVTGTLELASLFALLRSVEKTTAATGGYTLTIVPKVTAAGTVDGLPIHAKFASKAAFTLTPMEIRAAGASAGESTSAAAEEQPANPLTSSTSGTATATRTAPATLTFGVAALSVEEARKVALLTVAAIVVVVLLLLFCLRPLQARLATMRPHEEAEQIRAKFGRFIVPVERVWQLPGVPVIDVADIGALAQIAEHYERSILYEVSEEGEAYWVTDESGQFRYAPEAPAAAWEEVQRAPAESTNGVYSDPAPATHSYPAPATHPDPAPTAHENGAHDWHTEELDLNGLIDRGRPATA